ncbi:unnamed protein product [Polarella glacialis]|uniref:Uncharacterized protein n=1 Tax=Polarella glacialis TaxID=89957 RepID=A0A813JG10_POLGL|nr:unnamed protein product [Polarella glacialis]
MSSHASEGSCRIATQTSPTLNLSASLNGTRLARTQQVALDLHADGMMRQQHRAMTGSIYGHPPDMGISTIPFLGAGGRRALPSPLMAAGAAAAAPLVNTRVAAEH